MAKKFILVTAFILLFSSLSFAETVSYQHVRNATAKIYYSNCVFLVDPFLAKKGAYPGFEGTPNADKRIPLIDLAEPAEEIIKGVDAVILTHTHQKRENLPHRRSTRPRRALFSASNGRSCRRCYGIYFAA